MSEQTVSVSYGEVKRLRKNALNLLELLRELSRANICDSSDDEPVILALNGLGNIAEELDDRLFEADRERWKDEQRLIHWKEWARGGLKIGGQANESI